MSAAKSPDKMKDERQARVPESKVRESLDAFGCRVVDHSPGFHPKPYNAYIFKLGVKPNKDDPSNTHAEVVRKEHIGDMVHNAAKEVGIKNVLKQIGMGLRSFDSIMDDANGCVDDTLIPEYVGDIPKMAAKSKAVSDDILSTVGVDPSNVNSDNLESIIQDIVNQAAARLAAASQKPSGGDK